MYLIDKKLLSQYISGVCSEKQKIEVEKWINFSKENTELFFAELERWEKNNSPIASTTSEDYNKLFSRIIQSEYEEDHSKISSSGRKLKPFLKIAAAVATLVVCTSVLLLFLQQPVVYSTGYNETKTITLPDHSTVTLNANSSISFSRGFEKQNERELKLKGEAYFSIAHTLTHQKFIVYTSDNLSIEVLGTEFNVRKRRNETAVVLNSGKIRLNYREGTKERKIMMKPGELVELKGDSIVAEKKTVNAEAYSAWKENRLVFDNTSLKDIAKSLEEIYGKEIIILDDSLKNRRFKGTVSKSNLNVLLSGLSEAFSFEIIHSNEKIYFKPIK